MLDQDERRQIGAWPWTSPLTSLCLSFLMCKVGVVIAFIHSGCHNKTPHWGSQRTAGLWVLQQSVQTVF